LNFNHLLVKFQPLFANSPPIFLKKALQIAIQMARSQQLWRRCGRPDVGSLRTPSEVFGLPYVICHTGRFYV